eukprot:7967898-Alexandrium_andersonii.AAC.1
MCHERQRARPPFISQLPFAPTRPACRAGPRRGLGTAIAHRSGSRLPSHVQRPKASRPGAPG